MPAEAAWQGGWWRRARRVDSPNHAPRPAGTAISLVVLHSISLPPGRFAGDAVERLFTNRLDWDEDPYFESIRGLRVSAHFLIRRRGECVQFVSCDDSAWHAGVSSWQGRDRCNDFSIGIELEGLEGGSFTGPQYRVLLRLLADVLRRHPVDSIAGHEHVSPGRKHDPGPGFDWAVLGSRLSRAGLRLPTSG